MNNHRTYRIVTFLVTSFILSLLIGCAMPTMSRFAVDDAAVEEIFKTAATLSLAWNYDEPATIDSYKLYYRALNADDWIPMPSGTISADVPVFEMSYEIVGSGSWVFGVSSIASDIESGVHSSLDDNADPSTGWYLLWIE